MIKPKIGDKINACGRIMVVVDYCDKGVIASWRTVSGSVHEVELRSDEYVYHVN